MLKKPSVVDCNGLKQVPLAEFNTRFVRREMRRSGKDLPGAIRKALYKTIYASIILAAEMKVLVAKPWPTAARASARRKMHVAAS